MRGTQASSERRKLAVAEFANVTEQTAMPKKAYLESLHLAGLVAKAPSPSQLMTREDRQDASTMTAPVARRASVARNVAKAGSLV